MDQNQTVDNDLQKAIDDITNNTNIDPVFSDPVAAPSSIPEGDTGELGDPVGPFATPSIPPAPAPAGPLDGPTPPMPDALDTPAPSPLPTPPLADVVPPAPTVSPEPSPIYPEPVDKSHEAPIHTDHSAPNASSSAANLNMRQVKEAALRELVPLIDRLNMSPSQRFNICRNIFEDLRDYTVLEQAYRAASEISDPTERAEALLYLVESIDKM